MRILAIPGSIGSQSSNRVLLEALQSLAPGNTEIAIFDGISELPYFNPDLDREGTGAPSSVARLRAEIAEAMGLIISTPEYAHGIPGVLKNALDWLVSSPAIVDKPVALVFGSAGDARFAQASLTEILRTMSARLVAGAVLNIPGIRGKIEDGKVVDTQVLAQLRGVIEAIVNAAETVVAVAADVRTALESRVRLLGLRLAAASQV
jgi:NAD(P)H-dependent FMN reductase